MHDFSANSTLPTTKKEKFDWLLQKIQAVTQSEADLVANLANICALIKEDFGHFWVGFYIDKGEELVLGPFQGPVACTRIPYQKGVCGASYTQAKTVLVDDVHQFEGHIACSPHTRSEIVVPVIKKGKVRMVLDIDSDQLAAFDATDQLYFEKIAQLVARFL